MTIRIDITRETMAARPTTFNLPVIVSTEAETDYQLVQGTEDIPSDYDETTDTYKMAQAQLNQDNVGEVAIKGVGELEGANEDEEMNDLESKLNDFAKKDKDWYGLMVTENTESFIEGIAGWAESRRALYFASALSQTIDINYDRTGLLYHPKATTQYPGEAWGAQSINFDPGTATFMYQSLSGIDIVDVDATELNDLHDKNIITYIEDMGYNRTSEGFATSGEFLDVMILKDYIQTRLEERIARLLNVKKQVPFDNSGINMITKEFREEFRASTEAGRIARDPDGNGIWTLKAPRREDISIDKRANRILPDIEFTLTISGAIHEVEAEGVLKV